MKLTEKQIEMVTATAVKTALEFMDKEKQLEKKKLQNRRFSNVKLLLKHYRSFAAHSQEIQFEINELDSLLQLDELETDEFAIESIKRSKKRTLAMVKFINKMIKVYRIMCDEATHPEHKRRYQTIYDLYIAEGRKTVREIATCQNIDPRTVYRDVDKACEDLASLVFGVDSIRFY